MYKHASRNLQRKHRVIEARPPVSAYVSNDDLVATADNMGKRECEIERAQLIQRKTQAENELSAAKAQGDKRAASALGHTIIGLCNRLSLVTGRLKQLTREDSMNAFHHAAHEVLTEDQFKAVKARQAEILAGQMLEGEKG